MVERYARQTFLLVVVGCLFMGGPALLPGPDMAAPSVLQAFEMDVEPSEYEEDMVCICSTPTSLAGLALTRPGPERLGFHLPGIAPDPPPPKNP